MPSAAEVARRRARAAALDPSARVEVKRRRVFRESQHPRDKNGRWVETGSVVSLWGGGQGRIVGVAGPRRITVERTDGRRVTVDPRYTTLIGSAPATPAAPQAASSRGPAPEIDSANPTSPPAPPETNPAAGAYVVFRSADGRGRAWLRTDEGTTPVGYIQDDIDNPDALRRFPDADEWVDEVDRQGFVEDDAPAAATRRPGGDDEEQVPPPGQDVDTPAPPPPGDDSGQPRAGVSPMTDEEYAERTALIEQTISSALAEGLATDQVHTMPGGGLVWLPDRARQHKEIVDALWEAAADVPSEGRAVIAGGLGGAGKSTVLGGFAGVDQSQYLTINPDDIKEAMAERGMIPQVGALSPMEASALVHEESGYIANLLARRAYAERKNVVWDITMSSEGSVRRRLEQMRSEGYEQIEAVFVDIPVETSVQRALSRHRRGADRYARGEGHGGRYVPPAIIRQNASVEWSSANRGVFEALRGEFDHWSVWDNSATGREPQRLGDSDEVDSDDDREAVGA